MKVAIRLARRTERRSATALLLCSNRGLDCLRVCQFLGLSTFPCIYRCADGIIIQLREPIGQPIPGTVGLRALVDNLYLPSDAEMIPPLLDDEALALVKHRGLVFLPGGRVLEFSTQEPMSADALLAVENLQRRSWKPLPAGQPLADRISEIVLEMPPPPADQILDEGKQDIGTEESRPDAASMPARLIGRAAVAVGIGLVWLGRALHWQPLSQLGGNCLRRGLDWAPRLSEELLGKQEAALRALLRDFREGRIEQALRRALPFSNAPAGGDSPDASARLPFHNLIYSLAKLLGTRLGPKRYWTVDIHVQAELSAAYREQAERASDRGDHRRAAFIYAKLLGDYRMAAHVLGRGGLHLDAAAIYLEKLGDEGAAARAYEAGGAIDQALAIFRRRRDHERAGDLLRRVGEDELALEEYQKAAAELVRGGNGHHRAGELLLKKARRPDLAFDYFQAGWVLRPAGSPIPCAIRLAEMAADSETMEDLLELVSQAEQFLDRSGAESDVSAFFNGIARLSDRPALAGVRDELRDRALLSLAGRLRRRTKERTANASLASALLGRDGLWPAAVVSDAAFAVRQAIQPPNSGLPSLARYPITEIAGGNAMAVTAACWAPVSGEVFVGLQSGEVYCFRPGAGELLRVVEGADETDSIIGDPFNPNDTVEIRTEDAGVVISIATDVEASAVAFIRLTQHLGFATLTSYQKDHSGAYLQREHRMISVYGDAWLSPLVSNDGRHAAILLDKYDLHWLEDDAMTPIGGLSSSSPGHVHHVAALILAERDRWRPEKRSVLIGGNSIGYLGDHLRRKPPRPKFIGWTPMVALDSSLKNPILAWLQSSAAELELAGIASNDTLYWSRLEIGDDKINLAATNAAAGQKYRAAAIIRRGFVAGVTDREIELLACGPKEFKMQRRLSAPFDSTVACFPHAAGKQLVLVSAQGLIARVSI